MKKTILLTTALAVFTIAKGQSGHEISANIDVGSSALKYSISNSGDISSQIGSSFGVGYTYKFNSEWGIVSGIEWTNYKSEISFLKLNDRYMTQDNYRNDFEWRLTLNDLKEKLEGTYLNIPLLVQITPNRINKLYANIGFTIGIPLSGKYKSNYTNLVASGYYPETDAEYTDIDFRGFGKFEGKKSQGDIDFDIAFMLSAECGMKWNLSNSINLYTGGYVNYGLNNILKENGHYNIISYDELHPTNFQYNGLLFSKYTHESITKPFVDKIVPLSFGLKVKLGFSI